MSQRTRRVVGVSAIALLVSLLFAGIVYNLSAKIPHGFYEPSAHVRIEASTGFGSGVHIGNGYVLTAAHVVGKNTAMQVFADDNRVVDRAAEVLWSNTKYDIALLRVEGAEMKSAPLSCAKNFTGQTVTAYGNPMGVHSVYTRGEITGAARQWLIWDSVVPVAGAIIYGQSGGGVLDSNGNVVGIAVGLLMTQAGIAAFGWAVPAEIVCDLMGRA